MHGNGVEYGGGVTQKPEKALGKSEKALRREQAAIAKFDKTFALFDKSSDDSPKLLVGFLSSDDDDHLVAASWKSFKEHVAENSACKVTRRLDTENETPKKKRYYIDLKLTREGEEEEKPEKKGKKNEGGKGKTLLRLLRRGLKINLRLMRRTPCLLKLLQ